MTRVIAAAGALLAVAALAAGCGSAGWQASADQVGRMWGDPHPTIVRLETVQLATGTEAELMQLHGRFLLPSTCGGPLILVHRKHPKCHSPSHLDTVVGAVNPHNRQLIQAGNDNTAAQLSAFARARSARAMFGIFPGFSSPLAQCAIPGYGGKTITGTCTTRATRDSPKTGAIQVALIEHWPLTHSADRPYAGGWIVTVARSGRILSVRRTGDLPPQLWTSPNPPLPVAPLSVKRARRQLRYLRVFPIFPRTKPCTFGGGGFGSAQAFDGTCTTKVLAPIGNRPRLEFVERWHEGKRTLSGGWVVTLRHDDRVLSVRITGSNPPQSWR